MRTLGFLACLLVGATGQDFDKAKSEFKQAVLNMDENAVRSAAQALAASDRKEAVDALLDGYALPANQLKQLWAEKLHWVQEADKYRDIKYDGHMPTQDSMGKYQKLKEAQQKGEEVEAKIMRIDAIKRAIVDALASFKSDATVKELISEMKSDSNWERKAGIAEALGRIDHAEAVGALLEQLKRDSEAGVKVACLDALRAKKANSPEAVAAICAQLSNDFWQVKYAAAMALKEIKSRDAIEPLIEALKGEDGRLKLEINKAIVELTGVDKHGDYAVWRAWFDTNKDAVKAGTYQPKPEELAGARQGGNSTTFYGIPVTSKNLIFVLDHSGSMEDDSEWTAGSESTPTGEGKPGDKFGKPDGKRKIDILRWQLKRCISQMSDGTEFNIIFFNRVWTIMNEKMVKLSASTRKSAYDFIEKLAPQGGTNIFDPVEKALSYAGTGDVKDKLTKSGIDTIFLLSDGMPNAGQVSKADAILEKVRTLNKVKKVVINAIGSFSPNPKSREQANEKVDGEKFLKQLAEESGGVFVDGSK